MTELNIVARDGNTVATDKGLYTIKGEQVISIATGWIRNVAGSTTDENGNLVQLMVE